MNHKPATFLYYLPGLRKDAVTFEEIARRGLAARIGECFHEDPLRQTVAVSDVRGGPDGLHGVLVVAMPADGSIPARSTYDKDSQEWRATQQHGIRGGAGCPMKDDAKPAYWIGFNTDARPNPAGLARQQTVAGYDHELPDGNVWTCPTIRRAVVFPAVPCAYARLNGQLTREPVAAYREIWKRSEEWAKHEFSGGMPIEMQFDACVDALSLNYRIGPEEASLLGLLTDGPTGSIGTIIDAALDTPWIKEALSDDGDPQKKRAWEVIAAGLGLSSPGPEDSSPTTSPATQT